MSVKDSEVPATEGWTTVVRHDWESQRAFIESLVDAVEQLAVEREIVLNDYIDVEAIVRAFRPESSNSGASELQFECDEYVIRITENGRIAARRRCIDRIDN